MSPRAAFLRVSLAGLAAFLSLGAAFSPTLALYARDAGAPPTGVGAIIAAGFFLGSFIRLPAGALSTLAGRRKLLLAGTAMTVVAPLLPVLFPGSLPLIWVLSAAYAFSTIFMPSALAYVHDLFPESDRATHVGYYTTFSGIGRAVGPVIAGFILHRFESAPGLAQYSYVYLFCSAAGAVAFLLMLSLPQAGNPEPRTGPLAGLVARDLRAATADRQLLVAYSARLAQTLALGALIAFFPIYGREVAGLTEIQIGLLVSTNHVMAVLARPVTARLSSRAGRLPFMTGGMVALGTALVLISVTTRFWLLFPVLALMGTGEAVCQISTIAYVADRAGKKLFGAAVGIVGTFFDLGMATGQLLPGLLLPVFGAPPRYASGYLPAFGIVAGLILVSSFGVSRLLREPASRGAPPPSGPPGAPRVL